MPCPTRLLCVLAFGVLASFAHAHDEFDAPLQEMTDAANGWLASLADDQRPLAHDELAAEERENWHYIPKARAGLPLAKMNERQRQLAHALLASGLSQRGLIEADSVMALERVLRAMERSDHRDDTLYYFTVFGTPAARGAWGWRVEGHHLSVNFTLVDGHIAATPNFVGSNPAEVRIAGPQQGQRVLSAEEDVARRLLASLSDAQRAVAVVSPSAPGDILTRNERRATPPPVAGLRYGDLPAASQAIFRELVQVYVGRLRPELAEAETRKIAARGWEALRFAWSGSLVRGEGHYYRIQGPDFVIEYDNTQNNANHVHTVWRNYEDDFGRDLLQEHYRHDHAAK